MAKSGSAAGAHAKLSRAQDHLDALKSSIESFFAATSFDAQFETDRGLYVVRLRTPQAPPLTAWALLIGDCVHNMRSALDYVAWELAGADPSDKDTMFPICDTEEAFESARKVAPQKNLWVLGRNHG